MPKRARAKKAPKNDISMPEPIKPGSLDVKIKEKDIFELMNGKRSKKKSVKK